MLQWFFLLIALPIACMILAGYYYGDVNGWIVAMSFTAGIPATYFYWTKGVYKWYVWAYYNADNVYELDKAIEACNILDGGNWKEKFSNKDPEKYAIISERLNESCRCEDDNNVPDQTTICYSIVLSIVYLFFCCFGLIFSIASLKYGDKSIGVIFILGALGFTIWQLTYSLNRKPKIILNDKGITISTGPYNWEDISEEKVICESGGKSKSYYLIYKSPAGDERIKINNLAISPARLIHLLIVYRNRSNAK